MMINRGTKILSRRKLCLILFFIFMAVGNPSLSFSQARMPPISITVLYDNYPSRQGLNTGQGFSCLIQGTEKTVLFTTGGEEAEALFQSFAAVHVDPSDVDLIVISQAEAGPIGGLLRILAKKGGGQVFLPASVPRHLSEQIETVKGRVVLVTDPVSVCEGVFSTGQISREQALVVDTPEGLVILTGCARAGVVEVVEKAKSVMPKDIYLVMGGFHFEQQTEAALSPIVRRLRELGVKNLGATHCTGERAVALLKKDFGKNYIALTVGEPIIIRYY
jgi:7,8-dihydropterin-6-yl-methyl-4-(beta-D-ribofuranosyl)aminobenzene 5'-phosphate synthase